MDFVFRTIVWGDEYIKLFLEVTLPTVLARSNLPVFAKEHKGSRLYRIYTTEEDAEQIRQSKHYATLSNICDVEMVFDDAWTAASSDEDEQRPEDGNENAQKYGRVLPCLENAIETAQKEDAYLIGINPDAYPSNFFPSILSRAKKGKKLVYSGFFRAQTETFVPAFLSQSQDKDGEGISSRQLIRLGLEHMHLESRCWFWNEPDFRIDWPAHLYRRVGMDGIILNAFHLGAVMLKPPRDVGMYLKNEDSAGHKSEELSLDGNSYLTRAFPDENEVHLATDSDELFYLDLLSKDVNEALYKSGKQPNLFKLAAWAQKWTNQSQRFCFKHSISFHSEELTPEWDAQKQEAQRHADSCLALIDSIGQIPGAKSEFGACAEELSALSEEVNSQKGQIESLQDEKNKVSEECARLFNTIGVELFKSNLTDHASNVWQNALECFPDDHEILYNLSCYYRDRGDTAKALEHLRSAYKVAPENVNIAKNLIIALFKAGEATAARDLAGEFLAKTPNEDIANLARIVEHTLEIS
ncbi:MAG: tetratricopeptide repeat protein [Deltaproteobacteria bacterium]|nr:tetratricopeptide repeat protein [Deltaproteobacteria bacterium]